MINALVKSALALGYMLFLISAPSVFRGEGSADLPLTRPSLAPVLAYFAGPPCLYGWTGWRCI